MVTADDADAASVFDMARDILGNPYAPETPALPAPSGDGAAEDEVDPADATEHRP